MVAINLTPGPRRICKKCEKRLPHTEYYKSKGCKDGIRPECKRCFLKKREGYYQDNREVKIERAKAYYRDNTEKVKEYHRERRKNDPVYQHNAKEVSKRNRGKWYAARKANPITALADRTRVRMRGAFMSRGTMNSSGFCDCFGYTQIELHEHLHAFIGTPCYGCGETLTLKNAEIDHVIPLATAKTEDDVWELNKISNLRMMCGPCNKRWPLDPREQC